MEPLTKSRMVVPLAASLVEPSGRVTWTSSAIDYLREGARFVAQARAGAQGIAPGAGKAEGPTGTGRAFPVGAAGIEPATSCVSSRRSTGELRALRARSRRTRFYPRGGEVSTSLGPSPSGHCPLALRTK